MRGKTLVPKVERRRIYQFDTTCLPFDPWQWYEELNLSYPSVEFKNPMVTAFLTDDGEKVNTLECYIHNPGESRGERLRIESGESLIIDEDYLFSEESSVVAKIIIKDFEVMLNKDVFEFWEFEK